MVEQVFPARSHLAWQSAQLGFPGGAAALLQSLFGRPQDLGQRRVGGCLSGFMPEWRRGERPGWADVAGTRRSDRLSLDVVRGVSVDVDGCRHGPHVLRSVTADD